VTPRDKREQPRQTAWALAGRRAGVEAVRAGRAIRVLVARGSHQTQGLRTLLQEAERTGIPVRWVAREEIDAAGPPGHQGVVVFAAPPRELRDRDLAQLFLGPEAMVVVLDGITDPQNLGACARSAEAAGADVMVVRDRRAAHVTPAAIRASAGALLHLPVARVTNLVRAIDGLKDRGFTVAGLDAAGQELSQAPNPGPPLAVVVGSEGAGLTRLVRERCDLVVAIPMRGRTGSLNASAALAVGLFGYALRS
jgi:23S rRNA (guanosine2251-2'-O)-methyltransferase